MLVELTSSLDFTNKKLLCGQKGERLFSRQRSIEIVMGMECGLCETMDGKTGLVPISWLKLIDLSDIAVDLDPVELPTDIDVAKFEADCTAVLK